MFKSGGRKLQIGRELCEKRISQEQGEQAPTESGHKERFKIEKKLNLKQLKEHNSKQKTAV